MKSPEVELVSFLENFPLYRRKDFAHPKPPIDPVLAEENKLLASSQSSPPDGFRLPAVIKIEMPCRKTCGDRRTFERKPSQNDKVAAALSGAPLSDVMVPGGTYQLSFTCTHCSQHRLSFLVRVDRI